MFTIPFCNGEYNLPQNNLQWGFFREEMSFKFTCIPLLIARVVALFCVKIINIASEARAKKFQVLFILLLSCSIQPSIWKHIPMQAPCWRALPSPWNWTFLAKGHRRTPLLCMRREQDLVRAITVRPGLL